MKMETLKKSFYCLFAVVCTLCLFTACSDDDDDTVVVPEQTALTVNDIAGSYTGDLTILGEVETATVNVTKGSDTTATILLKDFSYSGLSIGDISVDCTATTNTAGDELTLNGSTEVSISILGTMAVNVSGTADGKTLAITISIPSVPLLGDITVDFDGTKD